MINVCVGMVFRNDSILRVKSFHHRKESYPLAGLQSYYEENENFIVLFFEQNMFFKFTFFDGTAAHRGCRGACILKFQEFKKSLADAR